MAKRRDSILITDGVAEAVLRPDLGAGLVSYVLLARTGSRALFQIPSAAGPSPVRLASSLILPAGVAPPGPGAAAWRCEAADTASARLRRDAADGAAASGWEVNVAYTLEVGALSITVALVNRAAAAQACHFGLRAWLPRTRLVTLRAGGVALAGTEVEFAAARPLPADRLDACFSGWDGSATVTWPEDRLALDIAAGANLPAYGVGAPAASAGAFCLAPLSDPGAIGKTDSPVAPPLAPGAAVSATVRFAPRRL